MNYEIEWEDGNFIATFNGFVVFSDIIEVDNIMYGDKRFDKMKFQLLDFSNIDSVEITRAQIKIISSLDRSSSIWNNNMKVAIVTNNENLLEITEFYRKSLKDIDWLVETFSNIEDARKWCYLN